MKRTKRLFFFFDSKVCARLACPIQFTPADHKLGSNPGVLSWATQVCSNYSIQLPDFDAPHYSTSIHKPHFVGRTLLLSAPLPQQCLCTKSSKENRRDNLVMRWCEAPSLSRLKTGQLVWATPISTTSTIDGSFTSDGRLVQILPKYSRCISLNPVIEVMCPPTQNPSSNSTFFLGSSWELFPSWCRRLKILSTCQTIWRERLSLGRKYFSRILKSSSSFIEITPPQILVKEVHSLWWSGIQMGIPVKPWSGMDGL